MHDLHQLPDVRIVLAANIVDGYPSEFEFTRDFLLENGVGQLTTISHPLQKRSRAMSRLTRYVDGVEVLNRSLRRPNFPPSTHVLDFATGLLPLRTDIWIGFNPVMTAMGALLPRSKVLVNWAIDFVPSRGENGVAEKLYRGVESFMMNRLDVQIENSAAALAARSQMTGVVPASQILAPIGVWQESFSAPTSSRHTERRVVYFGSMDSRNGAPFLAEVFAAVLKKDSLLRIDVIGEGESSGLMQKLANQYPNQLTFHGYIADQRQIDSILRKSVVALAPYDETPGSFTQFADPQKLKYYASNGVPTLLTNVAPAAQIMNSRGSAHLLSQSDGVNKWTEAIFNWLDNPEEWITAAKNSYEYALDFERKSVYSRTFASLLGELATK